MVIKYFLVMQSRGFKLLLLFEGNIKSNLKKGILFSLSDYSQLVDWTGRIVDRDKRGAITFSMPPIITRLNISIDQWLVNSHSLKKWLIGDFDQRSD
ncbi:MAG: hypothetical protein ACI9XU_001049 [Arenicella sp.]|jgi:hypothetical protein